jgi:hypothetical protein
VLVSSKAGTEFAAHLPACACGNQVEMSLFAQSRHVSQAG